MKGAELPIRLIAIVILVLVVVVAVIGMFFNVFSKGTRSFYEQGTQAELQSFVESCRMLCEQIQTTESLSLIQIYCNKKAIIGGKEYKCPDVYQCFFEGIPVCKGDFCDLLCKEVEKAYVNCYTYEDTQSCMDYEMKKSTFCNVCKDKTCIIEGKNICS